MAYNLQDVINWFLAKDAMSPKKLQKILYYAYAWNLTIKNDSVDELNDKLFDATFEAWVHGPVIDEVYHQYKDKGYNNIPRYTGNTIEFDEDTEDVLEQVWQEYGSYTGNQLENITHQEDPWITARQGYLPLDRCNEPITDESIYNYYIQQMG